MLDNRSELMLLHLYDDPSTAVSSCHYSTPTIAQCGRNLQSLNMLNPRRTHNPIPIADGLRVLFRDGKHYSPWTIFLQLYLLNMSLDVLRPMIADIE
jgi:hypothetical protein